jgi:hypothetical protein
MNQPNQSAHRSPRSIKVALCHHLFPTSASAPTHSCGSPALRGERFCFFHHPTRKRAPSRTERQSRQRERNLARRAVTVPLPRNSAELLASLSHVMSLIAANQIDLHRAGLLLEALKTAGIALRQ